MQEAPDANEAGQLCVGAANAELLPVTEDVVTATEPVLVSVALQVAVSPA